VHKLVPEIIAAMQRMRMPGALIAIRTPQTGTWATALGSARLATGARIELGDHLRIGSITKTFTATVILQLAQGHRLALDAPVSRYVRGVPNGGHITIRQLLQMTSGLYNYSDDPSFNKSLDQDPSRHWTPWQLLHIGFSHAPYFPPGKGYHYSNTNYILLGLIVQKITRRTLSYEFRRRIFGPLGMTDTSLPATPAMPAPYAHGYQFIGNVQSLTAQPLTGKEAAWADWSAGNPYDVTNASPSWAWAAGGGVSKVSDLLRYAPALATGRGLLGAAMQRQRLTFVPTVPGVPNVGYGLGVANLVGFVGHTGQLPGYNSFEGYNPKLHASMVVLVNLNQSPDANPPADALSKLIIGQVFHIHP
jgi:D-alanyl-D-alanine carboxypeptidase